jgi:DNA polymerase-3 subunit delta'
LAHAYLFFGPEGIGKRLTALTLAKAMNCQSPPREGEACEECASCKKINSSNHADVIVVEPQGEVIKIDQIRELQRRLRYRPLEGGKRACILESADGLNDAAANALLKTLEEPPDETHLFLLTSRPHRLLPTILSRCQWVKFKPLSMGNIAQILQRIHSWPEERAHFLAALAGGSAGKALVLGNRVDFKKRLDWLHSFSHISAKTAEEILAVCEQAAKEEEEMNDLLELWKVWVRDLVVCKIRGEGPEGAGLKLINHDLFREAVEEAKKYSLERLDSLFTHISDVQKSIPHKANRQLAMETLMVEMKKNSGGKESYSGRRFPLLEKKNLTG